LPDCIEVCSFERLGQRLGFVLVHGQRLGHHRDLRHALGLQLGRGVDEPLHLGHLLVLRQRGRLEFVVDPLLRFGFARPGRVAEHQGGSGEGHGMHALSHLCLLCAFPSSPTAPAGKESPAL
jgi:hypothetical protein